jgi:uncharacterized protein
MLSILLPYLLLLLLVFLLQRKMIYFPETYPQEQLQERAAIYSLHPWPSAKDYRGFIGNKDLSESKGTIVIFHGNAGSAIGRSYYIAALNRLGYQVVLAEYPGYGARAGHPSETEFITDGIQTAQLALAHFGGPIFLWGESLGGGVVAGIVKSAQIPVKGIALISPFDSLANVAQGHYWFFLAKWLIRDKFDNVISLQHFTGNTAVIISLQDEIVPNKYSLRLFNSLTKSKRLWQFENAGHNDWPVSAHLDWWNEVMKFINK